MNISPEMFEPSCVSRDHLAAPTRPSSSRLRTAARRMARDPRAVVCTVVIVILLAASIIAPMLSPFDYREQHLSHTNVPMGTRCDDTGALHIFGTDSLGRDLFTRCWSGGRVSLLIAFAAAAVDLIIGALYGGAAGCLGGTADLLMMRAVEIVSGIPYLMIVILMMMVLPKGTASIVAAYSLVGWIPMARLVRGQLIALRRREFITAARALGAGPVRLICRHYLPNTASLMIVRVTLSIPGAIFTEAWLSYLGLGVQLPQCSWGSLAQAGIENFRLYPSQLAIPAACISAAMLAFNVLGDALRDALDPRLGGGRDG